MSKREEVIEGIMSRTGKTREQAEAFLDVLGSGLRRRGLTEGEPLDDTTISAKVDTFLAPSTSTGDSQPKDGAQ